MFNKYYYTEKEQKELLKSIGIIIDKREKVNDHIIEWLDKKKIAYKKKSLKQGDYSFYLPKNEALNIDRDINFYNDISIERKANLDELATNIGEHRDRLKNEFIQHRGQMILMIENNSYKDIVDHNYQSRYEPKSYLSTLHSFEAKYHVIFKFINKEYAAQFIYYTFYYYLRSLLN